MDSTGPSTEMQGFKLKKRCVEEDILERRGGSEHDLNIRPPPSCELEFFKQSRASWKNTGPLSSFTSSVHVRKMTIVRRPEV